MKPTAIAKIIVDVLMTLALLIMMGYQLWGETAHEWVGTGMLALFLAHHILNRGWYANLFKGRFTPMRVFQICVDMLLLIAMLAQMYSGIVMSRHVFAFLPIDGGMALARRLHLLGAYWGFILMSVHLGLHWNMFLGLVKRKTGKATLSKPRSLILFLIGLLIAAYGAFVFMDRDFPTYLFLQSEFVFLDYEEPLWSFYLDYISLMGLWVFLAHYLSKGLRKLGGNRKTVGRKGAHMKKLFSLAMAVLLTVCLAACQAENDRERSNISTPPSSQNQDSESSESITESSAVTEIPPSEGTENEGSVHRQIQMTTEGQTYTIILYENPAADALYEMLPLELTFEDYNGVEKIAYLPEGQQLPTEGESDGHDPSVGDLCLYAPWGNLSLFYQDFGYSNGLVSLGRLETGIEEISSLLDEFTVTLGQME